MTVKHRVFGFSPEEFHLMLENHFVECNQVKFDLLYESAKQIAHNATDSSLKVALQQMRYDKEWFDLSETIAWECEGYIIHLAACAKSFPDLSSSKPYSYVILGEILGLLGWNKDEFNAIKFGKSLNTLVQASGNQLFENTFVFSQYQGGWLSGNDVEVIISKLKKSRELFFSPPENFLKKVTLYAESFNFTTEEVIRKSYVEAMGMLHAARELQCALYIIWD